MKKLFRFLRSIFWTHYWVYRNPYCRTCAICGQHEQEECWVDDGAFDLGTWEVYQPGDLSRHF